MLKIIVGILSKRIFNLIDGVYMLLAGSIFAIASGLNIPFIYALLFNWGLGVPFLIVSVAFEFWNARLQSKKEG